MEKTPAFSSPPKRFSFSWTYFTFSSNESKKPMNFVSN